MQGAASIQRTGHTESGINSVPLVVKSGVSTYILYFSYIVIVLDM